MFASWTPGPDMRCVVVRLIPTELQKEKVEGVFLKQTLEDSTICQQQN